MLIETTYDRNKVYEYAKKWALSRNPAYYDFENIGGDCTNYASQCIYSGCDIMNYTPVLGWYYINASNRTASWTGVEYLSNFLLGNKDVGAYAALTTKENLEVGDVVQLGTESGFYHSPIVCAVNNGTIYVAAHTFDRWMYPLNAYHYSRLRCLHILGARKNI